MHFTRWLASTVIVAASRFAFAQPYPTRQVISSASVGSGGDIALRLVTAKISAKLGQTFVVDSRAGANRIIAVM